MREEEKEGWQSPMNRNIATLCIFLWISCFSCSSGPLEFESVSYQTPSGELVGRALGSVEIFRGIPYAEKPLGKLRFAPAKLLSEWDGTLQAFEPGSAVPKQKFRLFRRRHGI